MDGYVNDRENKVDQFLKVYKFISNLLLALADKSNTASQSTEDKLIGGIRNFITQSHFF